MQVINTSKRKQYKGPSTVKILIALERATHKDPPTGTSEPNYRNPTAWSNRRPRRPPVAPPQSTAQCSGRGSSPMQRPIRQSGKTDMVDRGENASLQNN